MDDHEQLEAMLKDNLLAIEEQMEVLRAVVDSEHYPDTTIYQLRLPDGSWPAISLLVAKSDILHALTMLGVD